MARALLDCGRTNYQWGGPPLPAGRRLETAVRDPQPRGPLMSGLPVTVLTALCCGLLLGLLGNLKLALSRRPEHAGRRVRRWLGALNLLLIPLLLAWGLA